MRKLYPFILIPFFSSCITNIRYIGKTLPPTKDVEIFITEQSIKRPFEYIGKGYLGYYKNPGKIQKEAERIARKKGADAVLITDYYVPDAGTNITTVYRTDSMAKSAVTTANTVIQPLGYNGFTILFLKYSR